MSKGLIVKSPWLEHILLGSKTWDIRNKDTKYRGKVYLIKSGTCSIYGECTIVDSKKISLEEFIKNKDKHFVEDISLLKYKEDSIYAWTLKDKRIYENPIPYKHPKGAVVWVKLDNVMEEKYLDIKRNYVHN